MTKLEQVKQAMLSKIETDGCSSDRCTCVGPEMTLECRMGVSVETLTRAAVESLRGLSEPILDYWEFSDRRDVSSMFDQAIDAILSEKSK